MLDQYTINLLERLVIAQENQAKYLKEIDDSLMLTHNMLKENLENIDTSTIDITTNLAEINKKLEKLTIYCDGGEICSYGG